MARKNELVEKPSWSDVMAKLEKGSLGHLSQVRGAAAVGVAREMGDGYGVTSSDINHWIYDTVCFHFMTTDGEWPSGSALIDMLEGN